MRDIRLVVLSGPSGSGKSTAIKALEDLGFFCVDNMPVALWPKFMELLAQSGEVVKAAVVMDVRERGFLTSFKPVFEKIKAEEGHAVELLFLDASDDALVRRFSETRRKHPLATSESPLEGIEKERELLAEVRGLADRVLETTELNVHQLRDIVKEQFSGPAAEEGLTVNIISFGFRYGIPSEADTVVDVRFLPNPYFIESMKDLDGTDDSVREFILGREETRGFLERYQALLDYLVPLYHKEGKSYLTLAVGCTGGRHRSVVIASELSRGLADMGAEKIATRIRHRDIDKA